MEQVKNKEEEFPNKGLLQTEKLYEYILDTSVYPREPEPLKELRHETASHPEYDMATAPDASQLIAMFLKLVNAKKTIEIGVFTGYSLLHTALTIPDDGEIVAIDVDRKAFELGLPIIRRTGVENKINFIESEALPVLDKLLEDQKNVGAFDFAYVDADKENFLNYHERLIKLVKIGGIIAYDNTLWYGSVAKPEEFVPEYLKLWRKEMIKFNKFLANDLRVQISQVHVGDGSTFCMRMH